MLKSIPTKIMTHTVTVKAPTATDAYGEVTYANTEVKYVCVQPMHSVKKSKEDKEVTLSAVCFYDARVSEPSLDFAVLQNTADSVNAQIKVEYMNREFTVDSIDFLPDDEGRLHHMELNLI